MSLISKKWTTLGLGAAFASTALITACSDETNRIETPPLPPVETASNTAPGAQAGEGEGGVAIERAHVDPVVFNAALAITEAHIVAARDAYAAGEQAAAAEMLAHPVSEVLFDMEPILEARGVTLFDHMLSETSAAALAGESASQIADRTDLIIAALRDAESHAPDDGSSPESIKARVIGDQIDRAATMYRIAVGDDNYEPYLDGYGFYKVAETLYQTTGTAIRADDAAAAARIEEALGLLGSVYPSALRPDALTGDVSAVTVAASNVLLAVNN